MPAHRVPIDPGENAAADPGRRRALKLGAALGAGTIVWAEPTIKGLARRPAYAAAGSNNVAFSVPSISAVEVMLGVPAILTGVPYNVSIIVVDTMDAFGTYRLSATNAANGCSCSIDVPAPPMGLTLSDGPAEPVAGTPGPNGTVNFAGLSGATVTLAGSFSGTCLV